MRRTSVVLALVAAMVTVLVFAAPAFARPSIDEPDVTCPGAGNKVIYTINQIPGAPGDTIVDQENNTPPSRTPGELVQEGQEHCLQPPGRT